MVNTNELRFIFRKGPDRPMRILQQRWVEAGTLWNEPLHDKNSEWRDVPLVEDK